MIGTGGSTMRKVFICLLGFVLLAIPIIGSKTMAGENVLVSEYYGDNLIITGGNVIVDSEGDGDLYIASGQSRISGKVNGDVGVAGGEILITNVVDGDVRIAGGSVRINALVKGDVIVLAGELILTQDSVVEGDVIVSGGQVDLLGNVNGDVSVRTGQLSLGGNIGGNADFQAEEITIIGTPTIGGDLTYTSPGGVKKDEVSVQGMIKRGEQKTHIWMGTAAKIIFCLMFVLIGIGFIALFTRFSRRTSAIVATSFWKSVFTAILAIILMPIIFILLIISLIGIPLALLLLFAFLAILLLSRIFFSIVIGRWLLSKFGGGNNIMLNFFIGMLIFAFVGMIPFFGPIFKVVGMLAGTGAFLLALKNPKRGLKRSMPEIKPYHDDTPEFEEPKKKSRGRPRKKTVKSAK